MQFITSVTQKGQVTIPKELRKMLGIKEYDKILIKHENGNLTIRPAPDILDLAGAFKSLRKKSLMRARVIMEKKYHRF